MEEKFDIYSRDGKYLGVRTSSECHSPNPGFYHKPAWTWAYNSNGEILVQKRSINMKNFPGYWDMPCAGHIDAGETPKSGAIREAKEELGIDINEEDMEFMFEYIEDLTWEIGQVFFFKLDKKESELVLQEEEVEKVKWLNFEDFIKLLYSDKFVPLDKEYKDMVVEKLKTKIKTSKAEE